MFRSKKKALVQTPGVTLPSFGPLPYMGVALWYLFLSYIQPMSLLEEPAILDLRWKGSNKNNLPVKW